MDGSVTEIKQKFKENQFKIRLQDKPSNTNSQAFSILQEHSNDLVVKINEGFRSNDVLMHFLQQGTTIESFHEILPSLNEIFIRIVEGSSALTRSFQKVD